MSKVIFIRYLIVFVSLLSLYNLYIFYYTFPKNWFSLTLSLLILIVLIFRVKSFKVILKIWSLIFLVLIPGIQVVTKIGKLILDHDSSSFDLNFMIASVLMLNGLFILYKLNILNE